MDARRYKLIIDIKTRDGYIFKGRLSLPEGGGNISKLVIFIAGAGPTTYNTTYDTTLGKNFYEIYNDKGIAFFSYNTRGVDITDEPPFVKIVNDEEYRTYFPSNSVEDIYDIIKIIKTDERLKDCKVLLNGWSEGAAIAPLFAAKYPDMADALFLCGYSSMNLKEMQKSQLSKMDGGDTLLNDCYNAMNRKDGDWFLKNMGVTLEWYLDSIELQCNNDLMPALDLPIYIFHGASDGFCDVRGVYEIRNLFSKRGKNNLTVNVFDNHGHGLEDASNDSVSEGIQSLIAAIIEF
jgi:hypothetical protein